MEKYKIIMCKKITLVLFNVILVISLLFLLNWIIYKYFYKSLENNDFEPSKTPYNIKRIVFDTKNIGNFPIREPVGEEYKNKSIIIFGCSYAYGYPLEMKQTLAYKLSHKLKRPVYNYASPGLSPQFALFRICNHENDDIIKKSEYVIYITIGEHVWRVHTHTNGYRYDKVWPRMDIRKRRGEKILVRHQVLFPNIEGSYLYKYIQKTWFAKILTPLNIKFVQDYMFDFIKLHFLSIQKELKQINPNIKLIILVYHDKAETELYTSSNRWKEFEQENIQVFDLNKYLPQLNKDEYHVPDDGHPSELAWDDISDFLMTKL